jgi:hypothetical protein
MTKNLGFGLVGLVIVILLIASISAQFGPSSRARSEADGLATAFSLPRLNRSASPELRIWTMGGESGVVVGYVVRRGEISIIDTSPALTSEAGVRPRVVQTYSANDALLLIPRLRQVRVGRCNWAADARRVVVEGLDRQGRFAFAIYGHDDCEGWNLHILNRALEIVESAEGQS